MFCRLAYNDTMVIGRGLLILVVAIILGITATEQQLNSLTERENQAYVFNMNRSSEGVYNLEVLGTSYKVSAMYKVAEITNQENNLRIKTPYYTLAIPKYIYFDCRKGIAWLSLESREVETYIVAGWQKIKKELAHIKF
ncbi:hypothetical protein [Pelosinus sp. IPA-1]|uniref:hypothetical protein n=1 Tax=Pelosinus sp. IPA-1 TaxID=3029569 RepID=UPI0024362803|nr:hypothetical protein [Pelosinus sp. IPA-1]GMB00806.1 hypothetical protein PIPA1_36050 [Pelosinus sp. IPA-1]